MAARKKKKVLAMALEGNVVIVVGVTLVLIDKRGRKILPEGTLSSLWQELYSWSHNSLQTQSAGFCYTYMYRRLCLRVWERDRTPLIKTRNALPATAAISWPHLCTGFEVSSMTLKVCTWPVSKVVYIEFYCVVNIVWDLWMRIS